MLKHERLHFDITEFYARKIREMFVEFADDLKKKKKNCAQVPDLLKETENVRQQGKKENEQYDREPEYGENKQLQLEWEKRVSEQLKKLEKYK